MVFLLPIKKTGDGKKLEMERKGWRPHGAVGQEKEFDAEWCMVPEVIMVKDVMKKGM